MKFTMNAAALSEAAAWALRGISARPTIPALSGMLLECAADHLRLTGFDYETSARAAVACAAEVDGNTVVPGKSFAEIVGKLPKKSDVTVEVDGRRVSIQSGKSLYTLGTFDMDSFPTIPGLPPVAGVVDGSALAATIARLKVATSTDNALPLLMAVHVTSDRKHLTFQATDRYRLVDSVLPWEPSNDDEFDILLRGKSLDDITKMTAGELVFLSDGSTVGFRAGNNVLTTTTLDGDYPKIAKLFPKSTPTTIVFDRDEFREAVTRVGLVAEREKPVRLTIDEDETALDAGDGNDSTGREYVASTITSSEKLEFPIVLAFNPAYLAEAFATMPSGPVHVGMTDTKRPVLLTSDEADSYRHLLMPVRL